MSADNSLKSYYREKLIYIRTFDWLLPLLKNLGGRVGHMYFIHITNADWLTDRVQLTRRKRPTGLLLFSSHHHQDPMLRHATSHVAGGVSQFSKKKKKKTPRKVKEKTVEPKNIFIGQKTEKCDEISILKTKYTFKWSDIRSRLSVARRSLYKQPEKYSPTHTHLLRSACAYYSGCCCCCSSSSLVSSVE